MLVIFSSTILFAEEPPAEEPVVKKDQKVYPIGDGGTVAVRPLASNLEVKIQYTRISDAPVKARESLGIVTPYGKGVRPTDKFIVKLLDIRGYEICKQIAYYVDFILDDTGKFPIVVMAYQTQGCGRNSYEKVGGALVEYR